MTQNNDQLEPTDAFRNHLEWQIQRTFAESTAQMHKRAGMMRRVRGAVVILCAAAAGAGATVVTAQFRESQQRDLMLAAQRAEMDLANARAQLAAVQFQEAKRQFDLGAASARTLAAADADYKAMQLNLRRLQLNMAETQMTNMPPRDELTAPRVGSRDFVVERMQLDLNAAQQRLSAAEVARGVADQQYRAGALSDAEMRQNADQVEAIKAAMKGMMAKMDLRQRYLEQHLNARDVELQGKLVELRQALEVAQTDARDAEVRLQRVEQLRKAGTINETEFLRAQLELSEKKLQLQKIQQSMAALQKREP